VFENLTYKQKIIGLAVLAVLLFLAANKRSFRITRQAYNQVSSLEEKLEYVNSSTSNVQQIQQELDLYDKIIGVQGLDAESVRQNILDFTTSSSEVSVWDMEEIHIAQSNGFKLFTHQLTLEGDYNALIDMIYKFEKEFKFSSIISVGFYKEKEYRSRKSKLRAKIIFQNYEISQEN